MLLHEAHSLMLTHATLDNSRHFKMLYCCSSSGVTSETYLSEYVDLILLDSAKWLSNFPISLRSLTAVSKPKTAFLRMLTIPEIIKDLGAQKCYDVTDSVCDSYKKFAKKISKQRVTDAGQDHELKPASQISTISAKDRYETITGKPNQTHDDPAATLAELVDAVRALCNKVDATA